MNKFIKIFCVLCALVLMTALVGCGKSTTTTAGDGTQNAGNTTETDTGDLLSGKHYAVITVKDYGEISLELDADTAPITVTNFVNLVNKGFYDGLTFHRVIDGFMIQGGDPEGNGTGGSDKNITGEFAANGIKNDLKHERGVISMARSKLPDSASSQFFIMHETAAHLDGQYAAFGKVTSGMDVVDKIAKNTPVTDSNGTVLPKNQPVITSVKMTEKE